VRQAFKWQQKWQQGGNKLATAGMGGLMDYWIGGLVAAGIAELVWMGGGFWDRGAVMPILFNTIRHDQSGFLRIHWVFCEFR